MKEKELKISEEQLSRAFKITKKSMFQACKECDTNTLTTGSIEHILDLVHNNILERATK